MLYGYAGSIIAKRTEMQKQDNHWRFVASGRIGGRKSSDKMTPEARKERARKAGLARWAKKRKEDDETSG